MDIRVLNLRKHFEEGDTATDISYPNMEFESGNTYMITGVSGKGKTTLLNLIAGITDYDEGDVIIDSMPLRLRTQKAKDTFRVKNIGYIYQDYKLLENMTVKDNINILKLEGIDVSAMDEILDKLGILTKKNCKVKTLSGGQKQRVAIARALIKKPTLLLCDEPTGNLNTEIGHMIMKDLTDYIKENPEAILITVTHDLSFKSCFDTVINI